MAFTWISTAVRIEIRSDGFPKSGKFVVLTPAGDEAFNLHEPQRNSQLRVHSGPESVGGIWIVGSGLYYQPGPDRVAWRARVIHSVSGAHRVIGYDSRDCNASAEPAALYSFSPPIRR